jgi:hypothetical protein
LTYSDCIRNSDCSAVSQIITIWLISYDPEFKIKFFIYKQLKFIYKIRRIWFWSDDRDVLNACSTTALNSNLKIGRAGLFHFISFQKFSRRVWTDYPIENAYELVEVSETRSFDEIKTSFRKLAEETHPDLAESRNDSTASRRFVQILAAYEVRANRFLVFFYGYSLRVGIVGEILFTSKICYEIFLIEELIMPRKLCLGVNLDWSLLLLLCS